MIVVPVLITSCQVSEKSNNGPDIPQNSTVAKAQRNAAELPVQQVIAVAALSKKPSFLRLLLFISLPALLLTQQYGQTYTYPALA